MTVVAKSRSSLHKEKCDFNKLVFKQNTLFGRFQLSFINLSLTTKYTSEKLIA